MKKSIKTEIVPVSNNTEEKVSETESEVIKIEAENPNMNILSLIKNEDKDTKGIDNEKIITISWPDNIYFISHDTQRGLYKKIKRDKRVEEIKKDFDF